MVPSCFTNTLISRSSSQRCSGGPEYHPLSSLSSESQSSRQSCPVLSLGNPLLSYPILCQLSHFKFHSLIMPASCPADILTCMSQEGPSNPRFRVPEGVLQYHPWRDAHFPYLYHISTHALVHSPDHFITILVRIVNTSVEARIRCAQFDNLLSVPLGPNSLMNKYGTLLEIPIAAKL